MQLECPSPVSVPLCTQNPYVHMHTFFVSSQLALMSAHTVLVCCLSAGYQCLSLSACTYPPLTDVMFFFFIFASCPVLINKQMTSMSLIPIPSVFYIQYEKMFSTHTFLYLFN